MRSMTGYGKASKTSEKKELTIELKSVNHRFLDLNIKMPKLFNSFEDAIRKTLTSKITRGHIDIYVNYADENESKKTIKLDLELARALLDAAETLESELELKNDVSVLTLLKFNDVVRVVADDDDGVSWKDLFLNTLNEACSQLNLMREYEGEKLKIDLTKKIYEVDKLARRIDIAKDAAMREYSAKFKARIKEGLLGVPFDESKFLNEMAYIIDKSSIDEELTRLMGHIDHFRKILESDLEAGRQLDFLVQELNREANTICSKSNHSEITALGLKLKNEIEKIREQIQNVE